MSCDNCGSSTHRDDAMDSRCNGCEHLVRQCICKNKPTPMTLEMKMPREPHERWTAEAVKGLVGQRPAFTVNGIVGIGTIVSSRKDGNGDVFITLETE